MKKKRLLVLIFVLFIFGLWGGHNFLHNHLIDGKQHPGCPAFVIESVLSSSVIVVVALPSAELRLLYRINLELKPLHKILLKESHTERGPPFIS